MKVSNTPTQRAGMEAAAIGQLIRAGSVPSVEIAGERYISAAWLMKTLAGALGLADPRVELKGGAR